MEKGNISSGMPSWLKGSYSNKSTVGGTLLEIIVGGIPIAGDIGDIRDALHGIQTGNWAEVGASGLGFIPIVDGAAKGRYEHFKLHSNLLKMHL